MDENSQQVSIKQSVSQGERLELDEDILVKALKVPEHPGRVRAMGYGVRKSDYYPRVPRKKPQHSQSEIDTMKKEMKFLLARLEKLERNQKEPTEEVMGVPCNSVKDSHPPIIPEGVTPCDLYSNNPSYHMVGKGSVYNQLGVTLHNHPLPGDHVRVGVEIVLEGNAPLPVPNEDAGLFVLDDALGTHVA
ncbi:hypothetical protein SESBI_36592 [Sesbania bispinosa]|nr:hypothetical protein SESBI_36592 [Sesbania bispinosa]